MTRNLKPSWSDVGIPKSVVKAILQVNQSYIIEHLVMSFVFHANDRVMWNYTCHNCGNSRKCYRSHEDASICENCNSTLVTCKPARRLTKPDDLGVSAVVAKMVENYQTYFGKPAGDDLISIQWNVRNVPKVTPPRPVAWRSTSDDQPVVSSPSAMHKVQFICGEVVEAANPNIATLKAAVLCPFLWDAQFDWKTKRRNGPGRESLLFQHLQQWAYLHVNGGSPKGPVRGRLQAYHDGPAGIAAMPMDLPPPAQALAANWPGDEDGEQG